MFRKLTLLAVVCSLVAMVPQAFAAKGDVKISLLGGLSAPMGDFSDKTNGLAASMGFTVGPSVDYMMSDAIAIGVDGAFTSNNIDSETRDALRTTYLDDKIDVKYTSIGGGAHVKYFFPMASSPISPYLIGGLGMTNVKVKLTDSSGDHDDSKTKFGGRGGIGFGYKSSGQVGFGLEADYNFVSADKADFGVSSLQWVGVNAVVSFGLAKPK
jgi:outer membrane protein W